MVLAILEPMHDFRQAWRSLLARPGFTAAAVLTLALGIGATTAIFSAVYGVLFRPLPYPDAGQLVWTRGSLPDLEDVADRPGVFAGFAYDVALRTREIGIRLALGARPRSVVAMMVRRGALLAATGIAIGIAGGVLATRVLASMLYGVGAADPRVIAAAAALLLVVAAAASLSAARRVTRVDPMQALRAD